MISRRMILTGAALSAMLAGCSDSTGPSPASSPTPADPVLPTSSPVGSEPAAVPTTIAATRSPGVRVAGGGPEIGHGPRSVPAVALTFHGAGTASIARSVLGELRRAGVAATVMAVGSWLDADQAAAHLALDDGHELGNHTAHHLPMRSLSAGVAEREVAQCARSLIRITGSPGRWFRASGTQHTTATIRAAAAKAGYTSCLSYDVDSLDWQDPPSGRITPTVMASVRPGSIISLHLGHAHTIAAIPPLLDALRTAKLRPVTVSELLR